jgi:hypothetical protein
MLDLDPYENKKLIEIKKKISLVKKLIKSLIKDISDKDTKEQVKKELTLLFMKTVLKSNDVKKVKMLLNTSDEVKKTLKKTFNYE